MCSDWQAFQRAGSGAARLRASLLRSLGLQPPAGLGLCFGPMNPSALGAERGKKKIKIHQQIKEKGKVRTKPPQRHGRRCRSFPGGSPPIPQTSAFWGKGERSLQPPKPLSRGGWQRGQDPPPFCRGAAGSTAPARRGGRAGSRSVPAGRCRAPRGVPGGGLLGSDPPRHGGSAGGRGPGAAAGLPPARPPQSLRRRGSDVTRRCQIRQEMNFFFWCVF